MWANAHMQVILYPQPAFRAGHRPWSPSLAIHGPRLLRLHMRIARRTQEG